MTYQKNGIFAGKYINLEVFSVGQTNVDKILACFCNLDLFFAKNVPIPKYPSDFLNKYMLIIFISSVGFQSKMLTSKIILS